MSRHPRHSVMLSDVGQGRRLVVRDGLHAQYVLRKADRVPTVRLKPFPNVGTWSRSARRFRSRVNRSSLDMGFFTRLQSFLTHGGLTRRHALAAGLLLTAALLVFFAPYEITTQESRAWDAGTRTYRPGLMVNLRHGPIWTIGVLRSDPRRTIGWRVLARDRLAVYLVVLWSVTGATVLLLPSRPPPTADA
jgi:hypothetical protein